MVGSILDQAYEEQRKAEKMERLQALMDDPSYGTPDAAVDTTVQPAAPTSKDGPSQEDNADLWAEAPDRPQKIKQKSGGASAPPSGFWGELRAADQSFRGRLESGTVTPETNPNAAFAGGLAGTAGDVGETVMALGPGWQKLWHDTQAFFLENPSGLPRDWQLMSDESEAYFSQFPQPDAGEITGAAPFRSAEESAAAKKSVQKAQLRAAVQDARLRAALPTSTDPLRQGVIDATFNIGMMVPSLVAGFATKNPALAVSMMSSQTGISSYGDARRAGAEPGQAYRYGVTMGAIEGLTEIIPAKLLIGDFVKKTEFVEAFTKQLIADGLGEQAATHLQDLTTWLELNPDKTLDEFLAERPAAALRAAIASAFVSTALTGTMSGINALSSPAADAEAAPVPETPPDAAPAEPATPAATSAEAAPAPAAQDGAPSPEQADLLDKVNKVADAIDVAQNEQRPAIKPQVETDDQKFVRGVESALGIKRPAAPVETPEERRARMAERRANEERVTEESTARVVQGVRDFAQARAAAEQAVTRAIETPQPEQSDNAEEIDRIKGEISRLETRRAKEGELEETAAARLAAHYEMLNAAEGRDTVSPQPISYAEEMDLDDLDRTSTIAEAERIAGELEAMDSEDAKSAASQFRTLIKYSDKYDDNTFWQGFDEALEYAAPHLMTEEQQAAVIEKVAEAVEAAPLAPEEEASATLVEEVRATAPASRYFGRKSFGGEGLATEAPAPEQASLDSLKSKIAEAESAIALALKDQPEDTEDYGDAETLIELRDESERLIRNAKSYTSKIELIERAERLQNAIEEELGKQSPAPPAAAPEAAPAPAPAAPAAQPEPAPAPQRVAPKGQAISESQLAAIADKEQKTARKVVAREAMSLKAEQVYDDVLSKDVLERLDDEFDMTQRQVRDVMGKALDGQGSLDRFNTLMKRYAKVRATLDREAAQTPVQADFEALAAAQPDPGEGGLGRGLGSLLAEQGVNPETKFSRPSKRKPVKDPEKNRKRLDARAFADWGQNYLDLVQKGLVSYASAEELEAIGLPGGVNAVTIGGRNGETAETIINTSIVRPEHLEGILLHEVGVHAGLKGLMGAARVEQVLRTLDALVDSFTTKQRAGLKTTHAERSAYVARQKAIRQAAKPEHVREETLAYIVEDHVTNSFVPPFLTQLKVAIGRRFPGIIERLGWGSAEYAQLALVSMRRYITKEIRHLPNDRAMPGNRSPRIPFLLEVTYPDGFRKLARSQGSATTPQGWARRLMTLGQKQMWNVIRTLDLRNVDTFPQQLKDLDKDLHSPEVFDALMHLDPDFNVGTYLQLYDDAMAGDPDAAYELYDILAPLKGLDVPVDVRYSKGFWPRKHADGTQIEFSQVGNTVRVQSEHGDISGHIRNGAMIVSSSFVNPDQRGKGYGTDLYEAMAIEAANRGLIMFSDRNVSLSAARAWRSLSKRGFTVIENFVPATDEVGAGGASPMGMNPFIALPPGIDMSFAEAHATMFPPSMRGQILEMAEDMNKGAVTHKANFEHYKEPPQISDAPINDMANGGRVRSAEELRSIRAEGKKQQEDLSAINRAVRMFSDIETGDRDLIISTMSEVMTDLPLASELNSEYYYPNTFTNLALAVMYKAANQLGPEFGEVAAQAMRAYGSRFSGDDKTFMTQSVEDYLRAVAGKKQAAGPNLEVMFSADFADPEPDTDPALEEVYFNFMRFGDPDTVHPTIREALKTAGVKQRMGPPITLREVEIDAQNTNAFEAMVKSRKGQTLTFAELTALRNMHKYSALKLKELADMANADPSDRSLEAAVMRASMFHQALLAEIKGQSAQAARTLNAMKIQAQATAAIASVVDNMLQDANSTGDLRKMIRDLAQLDPAKHLANLNKRVEMSTWKAWQDLAGTWLRAMYLSMPSTHFVNALGNITTMLGSIADHHVAGRLTFDPDLVEESRVRFDAMMEAFVHQFTYMKANSQLNPLQPNTSINFDAEGVAGVNRWEGQDRALSAARLEKLSGGLVKATPDDPVGKLAEILGYALSAPSEALGVADDLFKGANYRISLRGQAFRQAREERRAGKITDAQEQTRAEELFQWPTEDMVKRAIYEAQENTFTRPVGPMTKTAMSVRSWLNNATGVAGYLLLPFILTPSNLMSFRFRRMPTAPLFKEWRDAYSRGGKDRAVAIAQVTNGTTLLMAGGALFAAGLMTGAGPDDPAKRKALMDTGWKPFALRTPDGSYVETNRLDPLMMPFHISASIFENFANNGWNADPNDDVFELVGMSALKFGQMMTDKTYMAGIANVFEAMASGRGTNPLESWVNRTVAGATTPALLAGLRRQEDPFKRQAFSIIDQIRNRSPVLSESLPKAYDVLGNEVMYQEGFLSAFQLVNPFAVSKMRDEPVYREFERLKYIPDPMDWTITVPFAGNSVGVSLRDRPDIYSDMTRMMGGDEEYGLPNFRDLLNRFVESDAYDQLSDINDPGIKGSKAQAISQMMERGRRASRQVILDRYWPDLQEMARKEFGAQVELGKIKEAENTQSAVTAAYQQLVEEAK